MTTRKYSSRSQQTTLAAGITDTATSCTVVSGSALLGGATVPAGTTFTVVIDPDTALEEIVDVTVVSTNVLTITRGVENAGTGQAHSAGAAVRHMAIGRDFREANLHIEATGGYNDGTGAHTLHGIAAGEGVVVGTDKTQTLTAKTLTAPTISDPTFTGTPNAAASIRFEGATADDYETTLTVVDPTQDNTITLPNTTGTVVIATAVQTLTNKTMGDALDAGGFKITNLATPTDASDAVRKDFADAQVAAAATSAASAATSAASAATSASSALTSANSASASQTAAATSAASAATSASTMAASVAAAAASATAAATSATSAAASATTAANSATAAATSATSAAASATAAATSATSAAASATTAANSVATIAGYATSAANSATAAATSATSAAASATASANSATASASSASASATSATASASSASAAATSAASAATSATAAATSAASAATSAASAAAAVSAAFTAKGDLLVGTGVSAYAVQAVGTNGQVLTANSAQADGVEWTSISGYSAPTLGSTTISSGSTVTNVDGLTINSTTIPTSKTLVVTTDKLSALAATTSAELAGVISDETGTGSLVFANSPTLVTPTLGTPASATLTNATGLPITGLTSSTTAALGVGSIELGHASDTTLARASAGVVNIEGVPIVTTTASQTLTNKTLTNPVINSVINNTLTSTTGDIIYASAANTPARLGIGSTSQVLTVAGGVPSWATPATPSTAKTFSLLSTTTLNGAASYTVSSLSGYDIFYITLEDFSSTAALFETSMTLNADTANHYLMGGAIYNTADGAGGLYRVSTANTAKFEIQRGVTSAMAGIMIFGANKSGSKIVQILAGNNGQTSTYGNLAMGRYDGTAVISSIKVAQSSGNFDAGTMKIYGAV